MPAGMLSYPLLLDCSGLDALAGKEPTKVSNPVF